MYDLLCDTCGREVIDVMQPVYTKQPTPCNMGCPGLLQRAHLGKANSVQGDEIDVSIKHGLCNPDGTPRRFRSREELARAEKKAGMTNYVEHKGTKGGDRSKHTTRWV